MSRFLHDLEAQLHAAARREVGAVGSPAPTPAPHRSSRFEWLWTGLRAAPVALAVLLTLVVVGGAFALLGHGSGGGTASGGPSGSGPSGGMSSVITPRVRQELKYIEKADRSVMRRRSCQPPSGAATTPVLHRRPGAQLLSLLGVLRRPPTTRDRVPRSAVAPGSVGVYAGYSRFARDVGGHRLYLVAARSNPSASQPPTRCFAAEGVALRRLLVTIPAALRASTRHLDDQLIAYVRGTLRPTDVVCLVDLGGGGSSTDCGMAPAEIRSGSAGGYTTEGPGTAGGVQIIIVPDGVATVTIRWPAAHGRPASTATGNVIDNIAAVRIPGYHSGGNQIPPQAISVIWRSATGRVLHAWSAPAGGAAAAYCRRNPIPCIAGYDATPLSGGASSSGVSSSSSSSTATITTSAASTSHP